MADGLKIELVDQYWNEVIPDLEKRMAESDDLLEKRELFTLYEDVLRMIAPYNFMAFNKFLELDEDHTNPNRAFYAHRKDALGDIFESLNDMEMRDTYDTMLISTPPRVGKTTIGIRFLSWIVARHPENTQLATSYSDAVTSSFYIGVLEVIEHPRFKMMFPDEPIVNQNAKREEIWVKVMKRYPSITFVPIRGSMTGRAEAGNYLYCDDLVSGIEEALSIVRMEGLWQKYTVDAKQRKKDGCKEIHIATRWSVHDPISKIATENENNPRCKIVKLPCYDEEGESRFNFLGGFSTKYYKELESTMDTLSFDALYKCEPIEREGLLYHEDELQYFFEKPSEREDAIVSICDSKNLGKDYVASPVGYVYGDFIYIDDIVYNNGLPEVTRPLVANMWLRNNVTRADVELNNGGNYFAEKLEELVKAGGGKTSIRIFYTGTNKTTKIISYADYVKRYFIFRHPSTYHPQSEYALFMRDLLKWTQTGNNKNDDAPDSVAMLAQLKSDMEGNSIKIMNRRTLGL